ncbi:STAS domain-containing protein [Streptomyces sp. B-S-A8]|uniref:Anti-sigma factor antagonist n=1 Tax=Streptomyces solicavernae TaxID=3043614 RepID=A0ABT6RKR7_9ACTN|nr:STAS domain-containing protein [Streptomyces sp. B-S-A8]MDI3385026.1 STAS domain-containing protein [Streptomyces sp. B-S-A8]
MKFSEPAFGLQHRSVGETLVLVLYGEIDAWAHQVLAPRLTGLLVELPWREVVVDLRPVTFLDASGLRLLVRVRRHCTARGARVRLVRGIPRVRRVLLLTGLEQCFTDWQTLPPELDAPREPCAVCGAPPADGSAARTSNGVPRATP